MSAKSFLHGRSDFPDLIRIVADEHGILPALVEKDYWIMHCLYGLAAQGFSYELKGGTSLSKGFGIINRFSEDIDLRIDPGKAGFEVFIGRNQDKPKHIESRKQFFDWLAQEIRIDGIGAVERDTEFDDEKYRSGGIRLRYNSNFEVIEGVKPGILLEVGFDDTTPNISITISSWALEKALSASADIIDNRAIDVPCYHPGYTFVEKLQAVSTKFRQAQQDPEKVPVNFLRHYYDISQLLDHPLVQEFIRTPRYSERKNERFRKDDEQIIAKNEAFLLRDTATRERYVAAFTSTRNLYFGEAPAFEDILKKIQSNIDRL